MDPTNPLQIADRLEGLEVEVRRLRGLAAVLIVTALALGSHAAFSSPRSGRKVVASELEIRDAEGRLRGTFGLDHSGLPGLKLYDHRGSEQVTLAIPSDDTSALYFLDRGRPRVTLESSIEGTASFRLIDKELKDRAVMTLAPDGTPRISAADPPGEMVTELPATAAEDRSPAVDFVGPPSSRPMDEPSASPSAMDPSQERVPTRVGYEPSAAPASGLSRDGR